MVEKMKFELVGGMIKDGNCDEKSSIRCLFSKKF